MGGQSYHCDAQIEQCRIAFKSAEDQPPWALAQLGGRLSIALGERGRLRDAALEAQSAWQHAIDGHRQRQGIATSEVITGYLEAAAARFAIEPITNGAVGLAHALDEMVTVYKRSNQSISDFNQHSPIKLSNPGGAVVPEDVQGGEPSAQLALLDGRPEQAIAILDRTFPKLANSRGTRGYVSLQALWLEAASFSEAPWREENALTDLESIVKAQDARWLACRLARIRARLELRARRPQEALRHLDAALQVAASWELGRYWLDLMTDRAAILRSSGQLDEARETVRMLMLGEADNCSRWWSSPLAAPAALSEGHRTGILEALKVFSGAETELPGLTEARAELDRVVVRPTIPKRRPVNANPDRPPNREEMHSQALGVAEARERDGTPFILYLTGFKFTVSHTASPFGPELLENTIVDMAPDGVNVIRIQDPTDSFVAYGSKSVSHRRRSPALRLDDSIWKDVAERLIAHADLIISEFAFLTPGVRFEIERALRLGRWKDTVLVLPPFESPVETVDNVPLIQNFPFCVWSNELQIHQLFDIPIIEPMVNRLRAMAALPSNQLRDLSTTEARTSFMPLDLEAIAAQLVKNAQLANSVHDGFWSLYRAAYLRSALAAGGEATVDTLLNLASNQLTLSRVMFDHENNDAKTTFKGDLAGCETLALSARSILRTLRVDPTLPSVREVDESIVQIQNVRKAVALNPHLFHIAPIYGPFGVRSVPLNRITF